MGNYLWKENDTAFLLPASYIPDTLSFVRNMYSQHLNALLDESSNSNPSLLSYQFKLNSLEVEKKLKFQSILPTVNFKANLLNKGYDVLKGLDGALMQNNYKWGLDIKLPIFFGREEVNIIRPN